MEIRNKNRWLFTLHKKALLRNLRINKSCIFLQTYQLTVFMTRLLFTVSNKNPQRNPQVTHYYCIEATFSNLFWFYGEKVKIKIDLSTLFKSSIISQRKRCWKVSNKSQISPLFYKIELRREIRNFWGLKFARLWRRSNENFKLSFPQDKTGARQTLTNYVSFKDC